MKKYWIKDLTEKQVIHAPTEEIYKKLCNKLHEMSLQRSDSKSYLGVTNWIWYGEDTCYDYKTGLVGYKTFYSSKGYEILTIDQLLDFQDNEYPKVMEVSHNNHNWHKRVVFMEKNGKFLAWVDAKSIEESEGITDICTWRYAREIQPATTLELTLDEIAEKFNVSPEQIKIKK